MDYLANMHALHRDLKPANIFLHFPNYESNPEAITPEWLKRVDLHQEQFTVKIGDLGFSKELSDDNDLADTYCGTPLNMAPELLNGSWYNIKADVWSVGTILF